MNRTMTVGPKAPIALVLALILAGASGATSCASPASPGSPGHDLTPTTPPTLPMDGTYKIVSRKSALALSTTDYGTTDGTAVKQAAYLGGPDQQWSLTSLGNGTYKLIGVQSPGKGLDIAGGTGVGAGASVQIWSYYGATNQNYALSLTDGGFVRISPVSAPKCVLAPSGGSSAEGAGIKLVTYTGDTSQQWSFQAVTAAEVVTPPLADDYYKITSQGSGKVLTAAAGATASGTAVQQATYAGDPSQQWSLTCLGGDVYKVVGVPSSRVLGILGGNAAVPGAAVQLQDDTGTPFQKFRITASGAGSYRLSPLGAPLTGLGVAAASVDENAPVQMVTATGDPSQQWSFTAVTPTSIIPPPTDGTYQIVVRSSGKAITASGAATGNGTLVQQATFHGGLEQRWTLTSLGNGQYKIVGVPSGKGLAIQNASTQDGALTDLGDFSGSDNQKFTLTAVDNGFFRISPVSAPDKCLEVAAGSTADGAAVQLFTSGAGENQQWAFYPVSTTDVRRRVVVSTDFPPLDVVMSGGAPDHTSDPDDVQSMVRFLLYSNEFDVEGLVATAATFAGIAKKQNILDILDKYDQVDETLRLHDTRYPTADALRAVTYQGRDGTWGKTTANNIGVGKDSEASDAIIAIVDKDDPRPIYFSFWGDCSNMAQAIWKVQNTRTPAQLATFLAKIRIYQIAKQDDTIDWLLTSFPDLHVIFANSTWNGIYGGSGDPLGSKAWINAHVRLNHGPLGAVYPLEAMGVDGLKEGDTPSFLYLVSATKGLNDPEDPTQPSWGGQFVRSGTTNHFVDGPGTTSVSRWKADYQRDFQVRAGWMVP